MGPCEICGNKRTCYDVPSMYLPVPVVDEIHAASQQLRKLVQKWIAQANHPMRSKMPEVREAMLKCASDLEIEIAKIRKKENS